MIRSMRPDAGQHGRHEAAVRAGRRLHAVFGQAGRAQPGPHRRMDRGGADRWLSEPPRRMAALPALRHSAAASAPTLGRLS